MYKTFLAFLFIAVLLSPLQKAYAEKSAIGTIVEVEGAVAMAKGDEAITPAIGTEIHLNDTIETGPNAKALILFIDNTEITLGENSRLTVDEYIFDADNANNNKGRFSVLRGAFVFTSGLISKHEKPDVKIETAYGSIGIRGTIVWGGDIDDEYNVFVQEGEITFATDRGRVTVRPGEGTKVHSKRAIPMRAKKWGEAKINRARHSVALKNGAALKQRVAKLKEKHKALYQKHGKEIKHDRQKQNDLKQDRKRQIQEKRTERRTEKKPEKIQEKVQKKHQEKRQELRGGNEAPDYEMREKRHLQNKAIGTP